MYRENVNCNTYLYTWNWTASRYRMFTIVLPSIHNSTIMATVVRTFHMFCIHLKIISSKNIIQSNIKLETYNNFNTINFIPHSNLEHKNRNILKVATKQNGEN